MNDLDLSALSNANIALQAAMGAINDLGAADSGAPPVITTTDPDVRAAYDAVATGEHATREAAAKSLAQIKVKALCAAVGLNLAA